MLCSIQSDCVYGTSPWFRLFSVRPDRDPTSAAAVVKEAFNYMLSDAAQSKASSLGFVPLKGEILAKAKAAVNKIGE